MDYIKKLLYVSPLAIGLVYLFLGSIWIAFSDQFVLSFFEHPDTITAVQTYKGWGFVAVSSIFIYILVQINNNKLGKVIDEKDIVQKELEAIFEQAPVGISYNKRDEKWIRTNQQLADMLGYSKSELHELEFKDFIHPDDLEAGRTLDRELIDGERTHFKAEKRYVKKDGSIINGSVSKAVVYDDERSPMFIVTILEDITRQKKIEKELKKLVHEKELLLAEVLHRVNNNLALITAFLDMELRNIQNEDCRALFKKSQIRIKTIGIVHQKLYQADDFSNLPLKGYIEEILSTVQRNWENGEVNFFFDSRVNGVKLNVNQAIPCGLILNELVTNACKHAFPNGSENNNVKVDIRTKENQVILSVSDNGVGLPAGLKPEHAGTLGFTIVNILRKQLDADFKVHTHNGTNFEICFEKALFKRGAASNMAGA